MSEVLLECSNVGKAYEDATVFVHVDARIRAGESVAVVGGSGEGKSTLLSIMGLLLDPSTGYVEVGGQRADQLDDAALSRLRSEAFGFVFQHNQLMGSLSAIDNVLVPACFAGVDAAGRAEELLERLGMAEKAGHYPHQLSVGQKRRVALARALLLSPRVLIADEPTNDLDPGTGAVVMEELLAFPDDSHAVVFSTHDMACAARADRVLVVEDGGVREIAPEEARSVFA